MTLLIVAIAIFFGIHLVPTLPYLREQLIGRLGATGYRAVFALASTAALVLLIWAFAKAPVITVWSPPSWTRWVAIVLMWPAFIFLVAAYVPGKIKEKLKHPFLVAIKTWALAHLIANGDLASMILFASFLAYAVYDRITLKHRKETSLIPSPATGSPRNDVIAVVVGTVLYAAFLLWLHPLLIGTSPLPR